jgi:endonuclease YncB( thermonuclease family)
MPVSVALADSLAGKVVAVSDGSSAVLRNELGRRYHIRIAQIQATDETAARLTLRALCLGKRASARLMPTDRSRMNQGRLWCDGVDAGLRLVQLGYARLEGELADEELRIAEYEARAQRLGIWANEP